MNKSRTLAISGASGFIGSYLTSYFEKKGFRVIQLNRTNFELHHKKQLEAIISQVDTVINLAGSPINKRWTKKYKQEMYNSRINTTKCLVGAINAQKDKPSLFISTSAVGYYSTSHSGDSHNEYQSRKGDNFLAQLCDAWEFEARKVSSDVRLVISRLGVVLSPQGGAFAMMSFPSKVKVSTIIGSGNQPFSWIDIVDVAKITKTIIDNKQYEGVINYVAPNKTTNEEFTKTLARYYKSFCTIKIPIFVFKIIFGEASLFICEGQLVEPAKLIEYKYQFETLTIEQFLERINQPKKK